MTTGPSVLIVGAGPTGLALALWLTRRGVAVRIIDKTSEPGTTSRALAVQARTLELYRQLGIADRLVQGGVSIAGINLWVKGRKAARAPVGPIGEGRTPFPFVLIFPQDAHERLLIEELEKHGVSVERRTELIGFEQNDERLRATLTRPDGSREICEAAYLAGCDGASSTVRQQLGIGFPGGTYAGTFYVADVEATGEAADDELHVDLEDADFLLVFPLKPTGRLRLVGIVLGGDADGDGKLTFDEVQGRGLEHIGLTVSSVNWFSTYRVHHRVANSFRAGRAFLLGDAAHIHSPVGGQGMNTGIGDAVNLGWKLAAVLQGAAASTLLDTYEPERIAFARRLVATTDRAFTMVTRQGAIARVVRTKIAPRVAPLLFKLGPMRDFLFRTVSQVGVNYRGEFLSEGATDDLKGGDRLPWIEMEDRADNFAPLASLDWQVHVYGEVRGGVPETCAELGLALHAFPWEESMARVGVERGALYLIRPDGHVALADLLADTSTLRKYLLKRQIEPRAKRAATPPTFELPRWTT
jgi:2-polyprenyl-6-methoxyphenol hydroxylase-like FAD-dependent oxidoreductase